MGRGSPATGVMKEPVKKDFDLLYMEDVQEIIENCKSYAEGQQKIMRVYASVYM